MNYLAHSYLSFDHEEILVGNMISDFVKGKHKFDYPIDIQKGIMLHREIDTFTDNHEASKKAKAYLKPAVGLYSAAFVDVVYDHFLANDGTIFFNDDLFSHATKTYDTLYKYHDTLPAKFQMMLPYMRSQNWLYNYRTIEGTRSSFGGVIRRAKYLESSENVFQLFLDNYEELKACYQKFFPDVKAFATHQFELLVRT